MAAFIEYAGIFAQHSFFSRATSRDVLRLHDQDNIRVETMPKQQFDTGRHLSSRRAVKRALDRHKVVIVAKKFVGGQVRTRVLVDGEYFDVDNRQLDLLEMGRTPEQIFLQPVVKHAAD